MGADAMADVSEEIRAPAFKHEVEDGDLIDGDVCNSHAHGPCGAFDGSSHGEGFLPVCWRAWVLVQVDVVPIPGKWAWWSVTRGGVNSGLGVL